MHVLQICHIPLAHLLPQPLLFLFADATRSRRTVASLVLPDIVQSPCDDQDELNPEASTSPDGAWYVAWSVFALEDLGAGHVA